jgi:hypothetical protein
MKREFPDGEGGMWQAFAADAVVAHGKPGAVLAFHPSDGDEADAVLSTITFNSTAAAEFALRTMGVKELRRRLDLARMAVGGV